MSDEPIELDTPWRRDPDELASRLTEWARAVIAPDVTVCEASAPGNGMSSETVLFDLRDGNGHIEHYVARVEPLPEVYPVFPEYNLGLQKRCMELVRAHTDVPAPEVPYAEDRRAVARLAVHRDEAGRRCAAARRPAVRVRWLGDGREPPKTAAACNATPCACSRGCTRSPRTRTTSRSSCDRSTATTALDQQLGYQRWYYDWAREGASYPLIERTFAWLEEHRPAGTRTVFNWGDSRIGNMLWRDFEPVAVLDWEMATVGPPEIDVAWMIFLHAFFQDLAARFEMPGLPEFMDRAEIMQTYEELSGHALQDLEWFEVYAALRFAIVSIRTSTRGIAYGSMEKPEDPDDLVMFRGLLEQMLAGTYPYWN